MLYRSERGPAPGGAYATSVTAEISPKQPVEASKEQQAKGDTPVEQFAEFAEQLAADPSGGHERNQQDARELSGFPTDQASKQHPGDQGQQCYGKIAGVVGAVNFGSAR